MEHPQTNSLEWTEVDSTNVQSVAYDKGSKTLVVLFTNGGIYSYDDVDMTVYTDMVHAESVGKYLNQMIKGRYSYLKWFNESDLLKHIGSTK